MPYSASGELLLGADSGGPPWQATLFGAAQDAARGQMWPSEQNWWQPWDARRRRTQGRRLEMGGRLTGVGGGLEEREREQIATRLGVATMRDVGRAPLGAQLAEPRSSDRGGAGGAGLQRDAGGSHGCRWCGQRSVGAAAPAAGGALGAGRQEVVLFPERPADRQWGPGSRLAYRSALYHLKPTFVVASRPPVAPAFCQVAPADLFATVDGYWVVPHTFRDGFCDDEY